MNSNDLDISATVLSGGPRKGPWRVSIWVVTIALVALGGWYWWSSREAQSMAAYITEPARRADVTVVVTATGSVEPTNNVDISSELSGTVRSVEVDFNDTVSKGQILARLDTAKLEATVEHARATLAATDARLALAKATLEETEDAYNRSLQLAERGIASQEAFQSAQAAYRRAEASVRSAEADQQVAAADLNMNEADLAKACICSPIDGIVLDRNVEVGQIVASALQAPVLFTLAEDLSKMELRVDIDEADIGKVEPGDAATFTVEAFPDQSFPATIAQLRYAPQTIDGVVTYQAVLSLDNSDGLLRPGMTAVAEIVVNEVRDALVVPNAALRFAPPAEDEQSGGGSGLLGMLFPRPPSNAPVTRSDTGDGERTIWILRDGAAVPVSITPGATDGLVTVVASGDLTEGNAVITDMALTQ